MPPIGAILIRFCCLSFELCFVVVSCPAHSQSRAGSLWPVFDFFCLLSLRSWFKFEIWKFPIHQQKFYDVQIVYEFILKTLIFSSKNAILNNKRRPRIKPSATWASAQRPLTPITPFQISRHWLNNFFCFDRNFRENHIVYRIFELLDTFFQKSGFSFKVNTKSPRQERIASFIRSHLQA